MKFVMPALGSQFESGNLQSAVGWLPENLTSARLRVFIEATMPHFAFLIKRTPCMSSMDMIKGVRQTL